MAKRTEVTMPDDAAPETTAERFREFCDNLPEEAMVSIALRRFPHRYTPDVSDIESLPAPAFQPTLDGIQEEIRRRCGPGKYRMWVRYTDPMTKKPIIVSPMFTLAPTASDYAAAGAGEPAGSESDGNIQETLDRISRAARIKAQATELSALKSVVDGPPAVAGNSMQDTLDLLVKAKAVLGGGDQTAEAIRLVSALKDLFPSGHTADPLDGLDKMLSIVEKLRAVGAPAGDRSTWVEVADLVFTHGATLVEKLAPYLPALLQSGAAAVSTVRAAGPVPPAAPAVPILGAPAGAPALANPPAAGAPTAAQDAGINVKALLDSLGGDTTKADRVRGLLDLIWFEQELGPIADDLTESLGWVVDYAEKHCPGILGSLTTLSDEEALSLWYIWDARPRFGGDRARAYFARLLAFARETPAGESMSDTVAPAGGTP